MVTVSPPCVGELPGEFFPHDGELYAVASVRLREVAGRLCSRCPFREQCRKLGERGEVGMWGGVLFIQHGGKRSARSMLPR